MSTIISLTFDSGRGIACGHLCVWNFVRYEFVKM